MNNLKSLPLDPDLHILNSKNLTFGTVNAHSIRNNINHIIELLVREHLDFLVITETWLNNMDDCASWLNAQGLHDLKYKYVNIPRPGRKRGGGLLLVYRNIFRLLSTKSLDLTSCESSIWKLCTNNYCFDCIGIYHPPASCNNISNLSFVTELTDKLSTLLPDIQNVIITYTCE